MSTPLEAKSDTKPNIPIKKKKNDNKTVLVVKPFKKKKQRSQWKPSRLMTRTSVTQQTQRLLLEQQQQQEQESSKVETTDLFENDHNNDETDTAENALAWCDTLQVLYSLQQQSSTTNNNTSHNNESCLPIPLKTSGQYIYAVLDCQLYASGLQDSIVARELSELQAQTVVIPLGPPRTNHGSSSNNSGPTVWLTKQDYDRAVRDAVQTHLAVPNVTTTTPHPLDVSWIHSCVEWFLDTVLIKHCTGNIIAHDDELKQAWKTRTTTTSSSSSQEGPNHADKKEPSVDDVIQFLVHLNLLLPCSWSHESYQVWYPTWPLVLQTWTQTSQRLVTLLKQSYYKEKSLVSIQKSLGQRSPIPILLLLQYLETRGMVKTVHKPSGPFIQLTATGAGR